ncbi:hypothetical protein E2C01_014668 [Portunus trituberculatus]|uniref:Uncharacterized protein n=1 Tax=Portunus trituberculatus TaxID=210409 RepID=A0A5B7DL56_PORTR|nr:hypothetical protein [Portunus trituberculatus]
MLSTMARPPHPIPSPGLPYLLPGTPPTQSNPWHPTATRPVPPTTQYRIPRPTLVSPTPSHSLQHTIPVLPLQRRHPQPRATPLSYESLSPGSVTGYHSRRPRISFL